MSFGIEMEFHFGHDFVCNGALYALFGTQGAFILGNSIFFPEFQNSMLNGFTPSLVN